MKCECSAECDATATHRGEWIAGDGVPASGRWTLLSLECAIQGSPTGPGYRDLEPLRSHAESEREKIARAKYSAGDAAMADADAPETDEEWSLAMERGD